MTERPEDKHLDKQYDQQDDQQDGQQDGQQDDQTTELGRTDAEPEGEHPMNETASTTDPTGALPVAEPTSALPVTDPTSAVPVTDPTSALPLTDPTSALPVAEPTSALPVGAAEEPFRVEPERPVPDDVVTGDEGEDTTTSALPQLGAPVPAWQPPEPAGLAAGPSTEPSRPGLVTVRRGPRGGTVILGLLSLVVAAWVMASNLTDSDVNLRVFGPVAFGALGGVFLLVGLVGVLTAGRRR